MQVIDNEPQFWFLLQDGDDLFLDLRVQSGFAEWTALLRLSPEDKARYAAPGGHEYLVKRAETLHDYCQENRSRGEDATHGKRSQEAIMAWIAGNPDAPR